MSEKIKIPRKLIETSFPLEIVNIASGREKLPGIGAHPRGLHLWWARRPIATARAILFAQLVNDPSDECSSSGEDRKRAAKKREELFEIIRDLVDWNNCNNEEVLTRAIKVIKNSWEETCELNKNHKLASTIFNPEILPEFHDPFAGGGAIPLESQKLGLSSHASDLNPIPVLLNKAMITLPQLFNGRKSVKIPQDISLKNNDNGIKGLLSDINFYGKIIKEEAFSKVGKFYKPIKVTKKMASRQADLEPYIDSEMPILTWHWTRTVKCPNPACRKTTPLISSFILASKKKKKKYLIPKAEKDSFYFEISDSPPSDYLNPSKGLKRGTSGIFECLFCKTVTTRNYVAIEGQNGRIGKSCTASTARGRRGRIYLESSKDFKVDHLPPIETGDTENLLAKNPRETWCRNFGLEKPRDLFTNRQLLSLATFSDLISKIRDRIEKEAIEANWDSLGEGVNKLGTGAKAYAETISVYLAFAVSRLADYNSALTTWKASGEQVMQTCKRQALPMVWDFVESNPFSTSGICWPNCIKYTIQSLEVTACLKRQPGYSTQQDAKTQTISSNKIISTDPPYYNNIVYSDLSDFFYVWLRRILKPVYPQLFTSTMTPKSTELVATPYRHENQNAAEMFFMDGMTATMKQIAEQAHPAFPITIYYALKQSENNTEGTSSAGWESFLNAVINANLMIVGTWPVRTESAARLLSMDSNALASSIVLVCRPQTDNSRHCSRREFLRELNAVLPVALDEITNGGSDNFVAPVDLSQAIIGPGMAIYSKYSAVLEADGTKMSVKTALTLINRFLAEDDFDNDTQFCLAWFEMFGWDLKKTSEADADVLARAKGASVEGLASNGIVKRNTGNLRLLKWGELSLDWSPDDNSKISIWEILHHMIRRLNIDGEVGVALIFEKINSYSENVRSLAYRLFTICDRKGWAKDAGYYNSLIQSWERIELESRNVGNSETHKSLFEERK